MEGRFLPVIKGLLASIFSLSLLVFFYPGLSLPPVFYLLPLLSLALALLFFLQERRCRQEKAAYASLKSESQFYRHFRHELLNHLQIIMCLSQLGQHERLQQALGCLSEKLKAFGEVNRLPLPALVQAMGDFIFSLPSEAPLSYTYDLSLEEEGQLSGDAAQLIPYLTDLLKDKKVTRASLEITRKGESPLLEIAAVVGRAEELQKSLETEKTPLRMSFQQAEETGGAGFISCSIPLTQARPLMKFASHVNNKVAVK